MVSSSSSLEIVAETLYCLRQIACAIMNESLKHKLWFLRRYDIVDMVGSHWPHSTKSQCAICQRELNEDHTDSISLYLHLRSTWGPRGRVHFWEIHQSSRLTEYHRVKSWVHDLQHELGLTVGVCRLVPGNSLELFAIKIDFALQYTSATACTTVT